MAQLLGQPPPTGTELLERLINGELVMQAASDTDFTMSDDDLHGMLDVSANRTRHLTERAAKRRTRGIKAFPESESRTNFCQ